MSVQKSCPYCLSSLAGAVAFCTSCGHSLGPDVLLGGAVIHDRYQIVKVLTSSAHGTLYRARDLHLGGAFCAIKEFIIESLDFEKRSLFISRIREEAYLLTGLQHPGIPSLRDFFDTPGRQYMVWEALEGESLQEILDRALQEGKKGIDEATVITWGLEICDILDYLHRRDPPFVLGMVRPSTIFKRSREERIALFSPEADFRYLLTGRGHIPGAPGFSPQEQFAGHTEPRSDLYSLGKTMLCLLTGLEPSPFRKMSLSSHPEVSSGMERIIVISIDEEPQKRYQSAARLRDDLTLLASQPRHVGCSKNRRDEAHRCAEAALELLKSHRIDEAVMECHKALLLDPEQMEAYLYLGHAYLKEGRVDQALEKYRKASLLEPDNSKVHCNTALALNYLGRVDEAIEENERALALDPCNVVARNNLGSIFRERGRMEDAVREYQAAIGVEPRYMAAHYNLGLTHYELGNYDESAHESIIALECDPANVHAFINLGLAYFQLGKMEHFVSCNEQVIGIDPKNARALNNLGVARYLMGDMHEASKLFRAAMEHEEMKEQSALNLRMVEEEMDARERSDPCS
jgi:tetratricopeptide (TPR) repeat protein